MAHSIWNTGLLTIWLATRYFLRNKTLVSTLALISCVVGMQAGLTATAISSGPRSIEVGRAGSLGQYQFQINVTDGQTSTHELLLGDPDVVPVWSPYVRVTANERLIEGQLHSVRQPIELGTIVSGRQAQVPSEATVSKEVSEVLGVKIGDYIGLSIEDEIVEARIVGVYVIDDDLSMAGVLLLTNERETQGLLPSRYLTSTHFPSGSALAEANQNGQFIMRDLDSLIEFALEANTSKRQNRYRLAASISVVIGALLSALASSLYVRSNALARTTLRRLGMASPARRRLFFIGAAAPSAAGFSLGLFLTVSLADFWSFVISKPANQYWTSTPTSLSIVFAHIGVGMIVAGAVATAQSRTSQKTISHRQLRPSTTLVFGLLAAGFGLFGALKTADGGTLNTAIRFLLSLTAVSGVLFVVFSIPGVRRPPLAALTLVKAKIGRSALGTATVAAAVVMTTSAASLLILRDVATEAAQPESFLTGLPVGSFQIEMVDIETATLLATEFDKRGGSSFIHELVTDTPEHQVRVVTRSTADCASAIDIATVQDLFDCAGRSPVNLVSTGWSERPPEAVTLVSPELLSGDRTGTVGLIIIDPKTSRLEVVSIIDAEAVDEGFSQYLSEAVLSPKVQTQLGVKPSGIVALSLNGLSNLDPGDAAEMRAIIHTKAGALVLNDDLGPQDNGRTPLAMLIALIGASIAFFAVVAWGKNFTRSNSEMTLALRRLLRGSRVGSSTISRPLWGLGLIGIIGFTGSTIFVGPGVFRLLIDYTSGPLSFVATTAGLSMALACLVVLRMVRGTRSAESV